MAEKNITIRDYDRRWTLIVGEVNTGKTGLTGAALAGWTAEGRSKQITVLDLAPEPTKGIGGRLELPAGFEGHYLTTLIIPPRLTAKTEIEADQLAQNNARAIEGLLQKARLAGSPILVVNDVTLYLQAGHYDRFLTVARAAETVLINAYYGHSFPDCRLSQQERLLTDRLIRDCDRIIRLPNPEIHRSTQIQPDR